MSDVKISQFPYVGNTGYTPNDLFVFVNYLSPTGTTSNTKIDDFKNFTIIDSYNYFLPLSGGSVTGSTTFTNGLTSNTISATTYQNLPIDPDTYVTGFSYNTNVFTINQNNGQPDLTATIDSVTGLTINGNLTVTGDTSVQGLTATTISATTYQNLPTDIRVTGGTYSNGSTTFTNNTGGTFTITGFSTTTPFTGGTVSGATNFINGLTANIISATTYQNLPVDPDTFVTGFTYNDNVFTIKQNNGQSDLTSVINSVTGWTVNGGLTVTGNTSINAVTATTINSGTVTVTNTSGTPSQATSFDSTGKLVAGLGQTTYKVYGNASLPLSNASTSYFVVPGLSQTFTVPSNCSVYVISTGGIGNTNGSNYTFTSYVGIFVDGSLQTDGGFNHINTMNPNTLNVVFTNTTWSVSSILNLSQGVHTVDIRARYVNTSTAAQGATVSGISGNSRQGELYIMIVKN
jgi:hypothetical protein